MIDNYKPSCEHEFRKTLARSGMYFISKCYICNEEVPYLPLLEEEGSCCVIEDKDNGN
jgi:hypothetical protein